MSSNDRQCAAALNTGERCPVRGHLAYTVIKRADPAKAEDDATRVGFYWVCEPHCDTKTRVHATAAPFRTGTT
jgi:hypothetical protein